MFGSIRNTCELNFINIVIWLRVKRNDLKILWRSNVYIRKIYILMLIFFYFTARYLLVSLMN